MESKLTQIKLGVDLEQINPSDIARVKLDLVSTLAKENKNVSRNFVERAIGKTESFYYKFYCLNGENYLVSNNPEVSKLSISKGKTVLPFLKFGGLNSDVQIAKDYFKFNGVYYQLISLLELPEELNHSELKELGDYMIFTRSVSQAKAALKLKLNRNIHYSSLVATGPRDIEANLSFNENEDLYTSIIKGHERLFECEVFFLISSNTENNLKSRSDELINELKILGAHPFIEGNALYSMIPHLSACKMPPRLRVKEVHSSYLFNLLPLQRDSLMEEGVSLSSVSGHNLKLDLFDTKAMNYNALVSGESGSGKSMLVQKLALEEFNRGSALLVLDLGNSFLKLAKYLGAKTFSKRFNPMQFKNPHYLKEFCLSFVDDGEISKKQEGVLFKAINQAVQENPKLDFLGLLKCIDKELSDFSLYFEEYSGFFTNKAQEDAQFVYVDTSLFPGKLKKGLILYLFEYFKHFNAPQKVFVIDEAWDLLKGNAEYIEECFRTFRKHRASAIAISQSINDFTKDSLGDAIANNSYFKIFLRQGIKKSVYFDEFDEQRISQVNSHRGHYSEFYLKTSENRKILRYFPTQLEYELFTSSSEDNLKIYKFMDSNLKYFDYPQSIQRWVDFKYNYQEKEVR